MSGVGIVTVARTFDMELVRGIITADEVYRHVSDDGSPSAAEYRPPENPAVIYLSVEENERIDGVFVLMPQNVATVEVHTCFRRELWGNSVPATLAGIQWVWGNTPFRRIVTNVPIQNRLAAKLARCSGMELFGLNRASFLKGGRLFDQLMFGISREALCP
jgi:RimJ/RimL family protein N-acetyltransferase